MLAEEVGNRHPFDGGHKSHPTWCLYYGRDRGETGTAARLYPDLAAFDAAADNDFAYLFVDGAWRGRSHRGEWMPIADMMTADDE